MLTILVIGFLIGIWRLVIDGILRSTWNYRHALVHAKAGTPALQCSSSSLRGVLL
jgi:hypothetical protein